MSVGGIEAPTGLSGFTAGLPGLGALGGAGAAGTTSTTGTTGSAFTEALQSAGITPPAATADVAGAGSVSRGPDVKRLVTNGIEGLEGLHDTTDKLAVKAATGDLGAIHQYTLAATEMSVATQLTVAVRNKAVEAFNEIMRMQV